MKNTLRIIINAYFRGRNTRCSSKAVGGKLPLGAMVQGKYDTRISVLKPINGLVFRSNFDGHSLSVNSLYSAQESGADRVIGAVAFVCFLTLLAIALGV
jgi:hypothetical protein